jgi:hypothetical protein
MVRSNFPRFQNPRRTMNKERFDRNLEISKRSKRDGGNYYAPSSDSRRQPRIRDACSRSRPFGGLTVCRAPRELAQARDHNLVVAKGHVTSMRDALVVEYTWRGLRALRSPLEGCVVAQTSWSEYRLGVRMIGGWRGRKWLRAQPHGVFILLRHRCQVFQALLRHVVMFR